MAVVPHRLPGATVTAPHTPTAPPPPLASVEDAQARLESPGYLASREIATAAFLSDRLEKPVLVEGPAGVGKTELARTLAKALGRGLIRLQCYEGLDEAKALYEWEYAKQLLYTQLLRDKLSDLLAGSRTLGEAADRLAGGEEVFFFNRLLLTRPLSKVITTDQPIPTLI